MVNIGIKYDYIQLGYGRNRTHRRRAEHLQESGLFLDLDNQQRRECGLRRQPRGLVTSGVIHNLLRLGNLGSNQVETQRIKKLLERKGICKPKRKKQT